MRILVVALTLLSLTAAAPAQEAGAEPATDVRAAIGAVLTRARDGGALQRVLGERSFTMPEGGPGCVLKARGELGTDAEEAVLLATLAVASPQRGTVSVTLVVDFSGAVRRVTVAKEHQGRADERSLVPAEELQGWGDDAIPALFTAFFLAPLHDQGLPDLRGRMFKEVKLRLNAEPGEVMGRAGTHEGAAVRELHFEERIDMPGRGAYTGVVTASTGADGEPRVLTAWFDHPNKRMDPLPAGAEEAPAPPAGSDDESEDGD